MRFFGKIGKAISMFLSCAMIFVAGPWIFAEDGGHAAILGVDAEHRAVAPASYNIAYSKEVGAYVVSRLQGDGKKYVPSYYIRRSKIPGVFNISDKSGEIIFRITHDWICELYYMESMQGDTKYGIIFSMIDAISYSSVELRNHKPKLFTGIGSKILYNLFCPRLSYDILNCLEQKVSVVNIRSIKEPDIINVILLLAATVLK